MVVKPAKESINLQEKMFFNNALWVRLSGTSRAASACRRQTLRPAENRHNANPRNNKWIYI